MPLLLYSTNVYLKYLIQRQFRSDTHFVWCSESFDSTALARYAPGSTIPPSSNPADIYRQLKADVQRGDRHSAKIAEQKVSLSARAVEWHAKGDISETARDDILHYVKTAGFGDWRPLIYIIPFHVVGGRAMEVPAAKRAGFGTEFIIENLAGHEFEIIEP